MAHLNDLLQQAASATPAQLRDDEWYLPLERDLRYGSQMVIPVERRSMIVGVLESLSQKRNAALHIPTDK